MKAFLIAAAASLGVALAAPAAAQHNEHRTTTTVRHTTVERHDNGWHKARWVKKKVCKTVWRNHHRVRHCSWQRVRAR